MQTFETKGIQALTQFLGDLPVDVNANVSRALNKGADRARTYGARQIGDQLNFPSGYLAPAAGRLYVKGIASPAHLESSVFARGRPTSLARFVTSGSVGVKGGVTVQVSKGKSIRLPNAFLIRLKSGAQLDEDNYNLGLAIRLKVGESIRNKHAFIKMKNGLALLYGPSVAQAFDMNLSKTDIIEYVGNLVEDEFLRLMKARI